MLLGEAQGRGTREKPMGGGMKGGREERVGLGEREGRESSSSHDDSFPRHFSGAYIHPSRFSSSLASLEYHFHASERSREGEMGGSGRREAALPAP